MNDAAMSVDPELIAAQQLLQSRGYVVPDRTQAALSEVRAAQDRVGAFLGEGSVPLQHERDLSLPGPHGQVPCRLYLPDGREHPPVIIYAHGGGFMQGSLPSWDAMLRELVRGSGVAALSVDYKLAPEHRFPKAYDEMVAVTRLVASEGAGLGIDSTRLALGGDSAGANLALATAIASRDLGVRALRFMLLIYGVYSTDSESASWQRFGHGAGLSQTQMRWIWETYLEHPGQQQDWRAAPILGNLNGLPPAYLIVGSLDPLGDDSHRLDQALREVGGSSTLNIYDGLGHGFIRYGRLVGAARRAIGNCAAALRDGMAAAAV
ncbi:MAG TPA: alpha/beta hydrolase [Stellaceae bacterium]|nr:alpha/beta hydrolase [Stellaceae bacterium]